MGALRQLRNVGRAVLDTMVLIYYLEDSPTYGDRAAIAIRAAGEGDFEGLVTPVTAAELLVKPLHAGRQDVADLYRTALASMANIAPVALSLETACLAGALRAKYGMPLPDMFQVAVALEHAPCAIVTNDRDLRRVEDVPVVLLDELRK